MIGSEINQYMKRHMNVTEDNEISFLSSESAEAKEAKKLIDMYGQNSAKS